MPHRQTLSPDQQKYFMQQAIESARQGVAAGHGGPFGACVVRNGELIACAHNTVIRDNDPSAHAEVNAIRQACRTQGKVWIDDCILFATCQPCPMCFSAIYWARIAAVYYGCTEDVAATVGFIDADLVGQMQTPDADRRIPFAGQVLADDCAALFAEWQRTNAPLY